MATVKKELPTYDRTPPHNIDAERSVLGAMLLNPEAVGVTIEILQDNASEVFYAEAHQHIYAAAVQLFRRNKPVDQVTLLEQLDRDGHLDAAGGPMYVTDIPNAVPTSANVDNSPSRARREPTTPAPAGEGSHVSSGR